MRNNPKAEWMTRTMSTSPAPRPTRPRLGVAASGSSCVSRVILITTLMLANLSCDSSDQTETGRNGESADAASETMPRAWPVIRTEIRRLAELPPAPDGIELRKRLDRAAIIIAIKMDRAEIERMIRTADKALPPRDKDLDGLTASLSGMVIARIADPNDEHHFVSRSRRWGVGKSSMGTIDWYALAMAAIDLYHDQASFKLLLEFGLKDDPGMYGWSVGHWDHPAVEALGFLRGYDSNDSARADVERQLRIAIRRSKQDGVAASQAALRAKYLKALVASWDYAKGLNESRRKEYREFERRLWRAWSLSRGGFRGQYGQFLDAMEIFRWREGDEGFFLRIFESPASTPEELLLAEYMAPRLSEDGKRRLQAVAKGDSPRASNAERALLLMKKRRP